MGALALASLYSLLSIPGDAIWHELYGIDLTAWSPPHLILGLMSSIVIICAIGVLVQSRPRFKNPVYASHILLIMLAMLLNVAYMIGVIEWEMPGVIDSLVA